MGFTDYLAIAAIALIVGAAIFYLVRAKKQGQTCVGCPYAKQCGGNCGGGCGHTAPVETAKTVETVESIETVGSAEAAEASDGDQDSNE